jgi:hypothetical protein
MGQEALRQVLRTAGPVKFAVANVGWVPPEESHVFWKLEVRPHLVLEPERPFDVSEFSEGYCYIASEWKAGDETQPIVVLEQHTESHLAQ